MLPADAGNDRWSSGLAVLDLVCKLREASTGADQGGGQTGTGSGTAAVPRPPASPKGYMCETDQCKHPYLMVLPTSCNPGIFGDKTCYPPLGPGAVRVPVRCTNQGAQAGCAGADGDPNSATKWFRCWDPKFQTTDQPYACYDKEAGPRGHERGPVFQNKSGHPHHQADSAGAFGSLW